MYNWIMHLGSPIFSSGKAYTQLVGHQQVHRIFTWLLLKYRLSTRALLKHKNMHLTIIVFLAPWVLKKTSFVLFWAVLLL
jgi:hypothetical protein